MLSSSGVSFGVAFQYQPLVQAVREFAEANGKRVVVNGRRKWLLAERDDGLPGFVPVADINEGQVPVSNVLVAGELKCRGRLLFLCRYGARVEMVWLCCRRF